MSIRDKTSVFLGQLGAQISPTLGKIGSAVGTAVAGKPGLAQMAMTPSGTAHRFDIPPTTGMLGAIGLPQVAYNVQYHMQKPQIAQVVGAGVVGAGALGLGAAGTAFAQKGKEKARMAGRDLSSQLNVQMPIVY